MAKKDDEYKSPPIIIPTGMADCPNCHGDGWHRVWNDDVDPGMFGLGPNPQPVGDWDGTKICSCTQWTPTDVQ